MLDKLEAQVLADRQVAGFARAMGGEGDMPVLADEVARFDAALTAGPRRVTVLDREQQDLRRALGVA